MINMIKQRIAFDICSLNIVLNEYALKLGKAYDENGDFAKMLGLGRNNFFARLRKAKILTRNEKNDNVPFMEFVRRGYFELRETPVNNHIAMITRITPKGQEWLLSRVENKTVWG